MLSLIRQLPWQKQWVDIACQAAKLSSVLPPAARGRPVANAYGIYRTEAVRRANELHLL